MGTENLSRVSPTHSDLSHRKSDMGRVTPTTDLNTLRTNNKALNQQLGVGKRDAKTDLVNPKHAAGNPFADVKRLSGQGLKPQQIALRMSAKGYPPAAIKRAMRQANPACHNMSQNQFNQHWKHHIQPAMRTPQAVRNQARMQQFKQQNGIPKNYDNMQGLRQIGKVQAREAKTVAKAQANHERKVVGQNRTDGVKANAIRQQAPKVEKTRTTASRERYNPAAAKARAEQARKPQPRVQQQTQSRAGMRR
ncbi:MAG: hypothetical protein AAFR77_05135 [Cyanobacteria bacterium J06631_2]